jgi:hypothetical protein
MKDLIFFTKRSAGPVLKAILAFLLPMIITTAPLAAQGEEERDDRPVREPWGTTILIDNPTTLNLTKSSLKFDIAHRFSKIKDMSDILGIYGSANTRLALDYGITNRIMAGFGTTRDYKLQDFEWKVAIFTQTRSGSVPLSLSYYGNMVIDASSKDNDYFGPEAEYNFMHRMSYLTQLIASRKLGEKVSLQLIPSFAWFNGVQHGYNNINFALSAGGRVQVLGSSSIIFEYDQPITQHEAMDTKPNASLGVEIGTSTHSFRIFVANYSSIIKQYNLFYNTNDLTEGNFRFGFNISVALR